MKAHCLLPVATTTLAVLTACGGTAQPATAPASTISAAPVVSTPVTSIVGTTVPTLVVDSTATSTTTPAPQPTTFAVAAGAPASMVDEQIRVYGKGLDPISFADEFGVAGFPYPEAPGVIVVEHQQLVGLYPPRGASRWDSVTYAFTDPRTADDLITAAEAAAGADLTVGPGVAGCTEGTDPATFMPAIILCPDIDGSWTMQFIRDSFVNDVPLPPTVVAAHLAEHTLVTDLGAQLTEWNLTRSPTAAGGYTLTVTYNLANPLTIDDLTNLYPGWTLQPDQGYGPSITDDTNHWTLAADGLQLVYSTADLALME